MRTFKLTPHLERVKIELLNLNGGSTHNQTYYSQLSDGGWEVTRIHDKFILHDVPQYGGEAQYVGIYDLSEIDSLIIKTEQLL